MKKHILFWSLFLMVGKTLNCVSACKFLNNRSSDFSTVYSKFFQENGFENQERSKSIIWQQETAEPFTELILSWNVLRPAKGYFSFFVSVKHDYWSSWYRVANWGENKQETFVNSRTPFVHQKHVRLELKRHKKGHAYKIKIVPKNNAQLNDLKALFVCLSNMNNFTVRKQKIDLPSTCIKGVRAQSQWILDHPRRKDFCSPTSLSMIINYLQKDSLVLQDFIPEFADKVHDDSYLDIYGNWILNVAQAFDSMNGKAYFRVERLNNFAQLYNYLVKKIPVAVSVRGYLRGGAKVYDNGHFILVVGWNNKKQRVLCIDPAFPSSAKTLRAYDIKSFLTAWGTSRNLSYITIPNDF